MALDAEGGGPGGHGPVPCYVAVLNNGAGAGILNHVSNGGANILVIGGGKSATDDVTRFWDAIDAALPGTTVTYVNGKANILAQSFAGFAMLAIVSDVLSVASGGLTNDENDGLAERAIDVANFVNGGGGLLAFSANNLLRPYAYLGVAGAFSFGSPAPFQAITPTQSGLAIGVTTDLGPCGWQDEFGTMPNFLNVLATNEVTGNPCAVGGIDVLIVSIVVTPFTATTCIGQTHTATATIFDGFGVPQVGV
ncbi:MAG: hypothetical protein ABIP94_13335, partial [Planctomycetota bacterium]